MSPLKVPYFKLARKYEFLFRARLLHPQIFLLVYNARNVPPRFSKPQSTSLLEQASTLGPISSVGTEQ